MSQRTGETTQRNAIINKALFIVVKRVRLVLLMSVSLCTCGSRREERRERREGREAWRGCIPWLILNFKR